MRPLHEKRGARAQTGGVPRPAQPCRAHAHALGHSPFFSLTQSTPTLPSGVTNGARRLECSAVSVRTRQLRRRVPTRKRQPRSLSPNQTYKVNGSDGSQLMRDAVPTPAARLTEKQVHRDECLAQTCAQHKGGASSCAGACACACAAAGRHRQVHQAQPPVRGELDTLHPAAQGVQGPRGP